MNIIDKLCERGLISQTTHEKEIRELFDKEKVTVYIGFDPTADSLHVGHFMQAMLMAHLQKAGHRPIALLGGGTAMVGDPTGKSDMRKMMTPEVIAHNAACFKKQLSKFVEFGEDKAIMVNNADWLMNLNYVEFLREVGVHFSVNRMLTAECFKTRLEKGLSFLEFNYMLMQGYDFYRLYEDYGCKVQFGGNDQWSNILGGVELVRRKSQGEAFGVTSPLLLTKDGRKMGKTESGALWLDAEKTSPYDFYQYWRNVDDAEVYDCLCFLTFMDMEEIKELTQYKDERINKAKERLAFETTKIVHGEEEAIKAQEAAKALFSGGANLKDVPTYEITQAEFEGLEGLLDFMCTVGLVPSRGEARRLVQQNGFSMNDKKITDIKRECSLSDFIDNEMLLRKGKKKYLKVILK